MLVLRRRLWRENICQARPAQESVDIHRILYYCCRMNICSTEFNPPGIIDKRWLIMLSIMTLWVVIIHDLDYWVFFSVNSFSLQDSSVQYTAGQAFGKIDTSRHSEKIHLIFFKLLGYVVGSVLVPRAKHRYDIILSPTQFYFFQKFII